MSSTLIQRSSTRCHHSPPRYEEEQANTHLGAKELLELRRALQASMISDIDETDDEQDDDLNESSDEEEKDVNEPPTHPWNTECKDTRASVFPFSSGKKQEAKGCTAPIQFLQLFLPDELI